MLNILGSLTKNGWRETFRILRHPENSICKQPSPPRKKYAHIRRRDRKGRKMRATAFRLVGEQQGREATKTYRRVNDGGEVQEDEIEKIVLERKNVVRVDGKGQRRREKRRVRVEERETEASPTPNGNAKSRHHRSVEMPRSNRRSGTTMKSTCQTRSSPSTLSGSAGENGARTPFSQPEMSKQDSHAFVFGNDASTTLSQSVLDERETTFTDAFARPDGTASSVRSTVTSRSQIPAYARKDYEPSSKETVTTVRRVTASQRNAGRGSKTGTSRTRSKSTRRTSERQKASMEGVCSVG